MKWHIFLTLLFVEEYYIQLLKHITRLQRDHFHFHLYIWFYPLSYIEKRVLKLAVGHNYYYGFKNTRNC